MLNMEIKSGFEREKSLTKETYFSERYFDKYQLFSLCEQINLLYKYCSEFDHPATLEIGKGNGFVSDFFKKSGSNYKTFDINKNLEPDIVGNILELNLCVASAFDVVICSEVLEHLEFDLFEQALEQLAQATNKYVIITLPEFKKFFGFNLQIRLPKMKVFSLPLFIGTKINKILGSGHYWEIDYDQKTKRENIEKIIKKHFEILDNGRFHTNPYHNFYVLEKR